MSWDSMGWRGFAPALIAWQRRSGRHGLPWQGTRDPYRIWLSEIMLQQTQVSAVMGYYDRFLEKFPDVSSLASASEDEVMALWSGLGYYTRARNLHRCARQVMDAHQGVFPTSAQQLETLPGIGASTAAAIAAFCHGERISIADGNVRRVLSRLVAFGEDLSSSGPQRALWSLAQSLLPDAPTHDDMVSYTQGLMDLGSGVCTRTRPACERCPVSDLCIARREGSTAQFPVKLRKVARRHESWWLLFVRQVDKSGNPRIWLERRPARGIWASLQCVPIFEDEASAMTMIGPEASSVRALPAVTHALTHRELRLHPVVVDLPAVKAAWGGRQEGRWWRRNELASCGLPTPVRTLLDGLIDDLAGSRG